VDVARLGNDSTVIAVWRGLECIRIIKEHGKTTDQTAERVKELEREYHVMRQNIVVDTDGLGAGVADQLRGCYNFHNAASPIKTEQQEKFGNLKTQCYFKLREKAEKREIRINADGEVKDLLCQELENIMLKNPEND
jgi:terminase large subunit